MSALRRAASVALLTAGACHERASPPGAPHVEPSAGAPGAGGTAPAPPGSSRRASYDPALACAGALPEQPPRARLDALASRCAPGTAIASSSVVVATLAAGQRASAPFVLRDPARCVRGVAAAGPGVTGLVLRVTPERGPPASAAGGRDALAGASGPICPGAGRHVIEVEVTAGAGEVAAALAVAE